MSTSNTFSNLQGMFKEVYGNKKPKEKSLNTCKLLKCLKNRYPNRTR